MSLISRNVRRTACVAVAAGVLLTAAACGSSSNNNATTGNGGNSSGPAQAVTMTLWTNATTGPGTKFFSDTVKSFEAANPGVTIKVQTVQNEDLDGKLQTALQAGKGSAPDIFLQRGGGKLQDMVQAGQVADITSSISADAKTNVVASAFAPEQVDGKTYAMPVDVLPGGFWYSKDLFAKAGIKSTPTTLAELEADNTKLKAIGVAPIAVGGKDAWPAAHWYYWFALRDCSQSVLNSTASSLQFNDPCWTKAGNDLEAFAKTSPFNAGFLNTPAQQGAGSSAGLVANHKAGMELMGAWDPGVIASLTPDQKPLKDLGFFPFVQVPGGQGDPKATMGGADGYSCSAWAPEPACSNFLNYLVTPSVQEQYATAFQTAPVNKIAQAKITDPNIKAAMQSSNDAPYVSLWLDTLYGPNVGNALNTSVVNLLAGKGSVQDIITTVNNASAKG